MVELGAHQREAIANLSNGKILCGGVGSGKSRAAIAYYYLEYCGGKLPINGHGSFERMSDPKPLYVITTARKRDSGEWLTEAIKFGITGDPKTNKNFVSITVDSWNNIKKYVEVKDAFFILDEQRLVGSGAWVRYFYKIAANNGWILLSGTPGDTWVDYIPVFVANGFYKNKTQFQVEHVVYKPYTKFPQIDRYLSTDKLKRLRHEILVQMPLERHTRRINISEMVSYDRDKFKEILKKRFNPYREKPVKNRTELFYLLRRVVNEDPSRIERIDQIFEKHPKLIVFYNFKFEYEVLKAYGEEKGCVVKAWNGQVHEPVPEGDRWLYLVQYQSGAEAWNCIETDAMAFFSLNYSWRLMEQARGRIDRMNTPFTDLYYYVLRSNSPIDAVIHKALIRKQNFNEKSVDLTKFGGG